MMGEYGGGGKVLDTSLYTFFQTDHLTYIINHITHTFLNQKSPRIISLLSYFQANSQTLIEQHVLLVLKL